MSENEKNLSKLGSYLRRGVGIGQISTASTAAAVVLRDSPDPLLLRRRFRHLICFPIFGSILAEFCLTRRSQFKLPVTAMNLPIYCVGSDRDRISSYWIDPGRNSFVNVSPVQVLNRAIEKPNPEEMLFASTSYQRLYFDAKWSYSCTSKFIFFVIIFLRDIRTTRNPHGVEF